MLLIFFPSIIQTIHEAIHHGEEHCMEKNEKHFHTATHQCSVCHFTIDFTSPTVRVEAVIHEIEYFFENNGFSLLHFIQTNLEFFSLRAPPFEY